MVHGGSCFHNFDREALAVLEVGNVVQAEYLKKKGNIKEDRIRYDNPPLKSSLQNQLSIQYQTLVWIPSSIKKNVYVVLNGGHPHYHINHHVTHSDFSSVMFVVHADLNFDKKIISYIILHWLTYHFLRSLMNVEFVDSVVDSNWMN